MSFQMLEDPVSKYTNHQMVVVASNFKISDAAKTMTESKVDSILVFEDDDVIGIVTQKDILSDVVAKGKDPTKVTVKEIMHKPIISIDKDAKVREAIALMSKHDIRRLIVRNEKRSIGIISQKMIVGNMCETDALMPELEIPHKIRCPYCDSLSDDKKSLSKHIDNFHIGRGLLEGDLSKL